MMTRFNRLSKTVPSKVQAAWRLMQDDPTQTLQTAAAAVGMGTRQLRGALAAPHVKKWLLEERRLLLESINASNPEALRRIRDSSDNSMAQVSAIKTLEALKELVEPSARVGMPQHAPGLVVQIINQTGEVTQTIGGLPPSAPMIDITPERETRESQERL
jgi:hypothetical protein